MLKAEEASNGNDENHKPRNRRGTYILKDAQRVVVEQNIKAKHIITSYYDILQVTIS